MSIDTVEQQEKLLLACITLNFVEDLEEFKEFQDQLKKKDTKQY